MSWIRWGIEKAADVMVDFILDKFREKPNSKIEGIKKHIIEVIENKENQGVVVAKSKIQDFNTKSILYVKPGEEAVFINDGEIVGVLSEGKHTLDTANYPFISSMISIISGNQRIHSSSLYFIRTAVSQPLDWGTSLQIRDPVQLISTRVMCRGVYRICIVDSRKFIRYFLGNGWERLEQKELSHLLQDEIRQFIKAYLTECIKTSNEEILGISSKQQILSMELEKIIKYRYIQYGFIIDSFSIAGMNILEENRDRHIIEEAYRKKRVEAIKKE